MAEATAATATKLSIWDASKRSAKPMALAPVTNELLGRSALALGSYLCTSDGPPSDHLETNEVINMFALAQLAARRVH
jgi:hypothetical protein